MKKGFTLIEVLAVIVIISLITILVMPNLLNSVNNKRSEVSDSAKRMIYDATDIYVKENSDNYPTNYTPAIYCIKLEDLVNSGKLTNPIKDMKNDKEIPLNYYVKTTLDEYSQYKYELVDNNSCTSNFDTTAPYIYLTNSGRNITLRASDEGSTVSVVTLPNGQTVDLSNSNSKVKVLFLYKEDSAAEFPVSTYKRYLELGKFEYEILVTADFTLEQLVEKSKNYDVVFMNNRYWGFNSTLVNTLYDNKVNLVTVGNGGDNNLKILSGATVITAGSSNPKTNITRKLENEVTIRISKNLGNSTDAQYALVVNNSNVEVWYNSTIGDVIYDELMYLENNNTRWLHYQYYIANAHHQIPVIQSIERVSGSKTVKYTAPSAGTYTFKVTDSFGNESTKSITVE